MVNWDFDYEGNSTIRSSLGWGGEEIKLRENDKDLLVGGTPQLVVIGGRVRVHRVEAHGAVDSRAGHGRQLPAAAVAGGGR